MATTMKTARRPYTRFGRTRRGLMFCFAIIVGIIASAYLVARALGESMYLEVTDSKTMEALHRAETKILEKIPRAAKIITCPQCRLLSLPAVREFVYDYAKLFQPALRVQFSYGEDPRLLLFKFGRKVEEIDLAVR